MDTQEEVTMGLLSWLFSRKPDGVMHVRTYTKTHVSHLGTSRIKCEHYRAVSSDRAREFLARMKVGTKVQRITVETPQGSWRKDGEGTFKVRNN